MNSIEEKNYFEKNKTIICLLVLLFIMVGYYIYSYNTNIINLPDKIIQSAGSVNNTNLYISNFNELNKLLDIF